MARALSITMLHVVHSAPVDSVDWTIRGAVNPVRDQGQCGVPWMFAVAENLESNWEIATGKLHTLSVQQFSDCTGHTGCSSSLMDLAWIQHTDLCTADSYVGGCNASQCTVAIPKGSVVGFKNVTDEVALLDAVSAGTVSIGIEADQAAFQEYSAGVISSGCGTSLDHDVLVVGYGTMAGTDYWKILNSWGASWGDAGYAKIKRGGECGVGQFGVYPIFHFPQVDSVDWTTRGAVNPVREQGQCGVPWMFAVAENLESNWEIATGDMHTLSLQQFSDCTGHTGCSGGPPMDLAWIQHTDLCTADSYIGGCNVSECTVAIPKGSVVGFKNVTDEAALLDAVSVGTVSVGIEADQIAFQEYSAGVISSGCGTSLDHDVLVVGYGTMAGTDYWKIMNSWGASWGDAGYAKIERGGVCGVGSFGMYPDFNAQMQSIYV